MRQRPHVEVLQVVKIQTDRLLQLITCFLASKYDMRTFQDLMQTIISPSAALIVSDSNQNLHTRQKSFSFEGGSSAGVKQSLSSKGKFQCNKVSQQANPFTLEQVSPQVKDNDSEDQPQTYHTEESPRSPLRLEEVKLCNEMIDRLRAECQEYELTIVEQDREIAHLRELVKDPRVKIDKQENQSLIQRFQNDLRSSRVDNERLQSQLIESSQVIQSLQDQIRELKGQLGEPRRMDVRRDAEYQMQLRELEGVKKDNAQLSQRYKDLQDILRQKELKLVETKKYSDEQLLKAQQDAEECIQYFKQLALQAKGKTITNEEPFHQHFPQSLAPSLQVEDNKKRSSSVGAKRVNQFMNKDEFSFTAKEDSFEKQIKMHDLEQPPILLVAIESMQRSFEEIAQIKQGLLDQVTQSRDLYCDSVKQFSILSYDYIDKIQVICGQEQVLLQQLEHQSALVQDLKQISLQQTKHIRAQSELIIAQKDKLQIFTDFMDRQFKRKDKERAAFCKYAFTELPLLSESILQTTKSLSQYNIIDSKQHSQLKDIVNVHEMTKSKVRMLEEELEKSLAQNQNDEQQLKEWVSKYERLQGLVQDVWTVEVKEYQNCESKQFSFVRVDGDQVPTPVNWLSEIRDTLRQLRETNEFQKEECFQLLNMLNTDNRTETDFQQSDQDNSSRGIDDIGSEGQMSEKVQRLNSNSTESHGQVTSPRGSKQVSRRLQQHLTEMNDLNQRPARSTSADNQYRGIFSQRTPKNVRFDQPALQNSIKSLGPKLLLSSQGSTHRSQVNNRNELQQMLRDEIYKLKRDFTVSRETTVQMTLEIKGLRRELGDSNQTIEQVGLQLQDYKSKTEQLLNDLKESHQMIEDSENSIRNKDETIDQLKLQIDDFENELQDLQQSMQNVGDLNNQISQQCEQWEYCHGQLQLELQNTVQQHQQTVSEIQNQHSEKQSKYKQRIQDKEKEISQLLVQIGQLKELHDQIELRKKLACDKGSDTSEFLLNIEKENESLRVQLNRVKLDVTAVLEQYDRQSAINKQLKKKFDKMKTEKDTLISKFKIDLEESQIQLSKLQAQSQERIQHVQDHFQKELDQEQQTNQNLQCEVDSLTQHADDLQSQIINANNDIQQLQSHLVESEQTIKKLEAKIREMLSESHLDKKTINKYREKAASLKRKRVTSRQNHHAMSQLTGKPPQHQVNSVNDSQELSSESPSRVSEFIQVHEQNIADKQFADQDTRNKFKRANQRVQNMSDNSYGQMQRPSKSPGNHNPFTNQSNLSNLSNDYASPYYKQTDSCYNSNCMASLHTKPSFFQQANNQQFTELKWKEEANKIAKRKVNKVIKYITDLVKVHSRQLIEQAAVPQNQDGYSSLQQLQLNKQVQEWSTDKLLDCWAIEESAIIDAKAYFNKHSPIVITCLKLLMENNLKSLKETIQPTLNQAPTLRSLQFQIQKETVTEESQQSTSRSNQDCQPAEVQNSKEQDFIKAYGDLANHCQQLMQSYVQMGRTLSSICFGGCILVGQSFPQEVKDSVDFAIKYLSQDTSLLESTQQDTMSQINKVIENLVQCLQHIVKASCQVIVNRSSLSKSDANKILDSYQQSCEFSIQQKSQSVQSNFCAQQVNSHTFANTSRNEEQKDVRDRLQEVENRLRSKFQQVSQMESNLDKLLMNQKAQERASYNETTESGLSNKSSVLSDTKTVLKLLTTVKRVVSKLKIEIHQDYLALGNINVGLMRTPSMSSYQLSSQNTQDAKVNQLILGPKLLQKDQENLPRGSTETKKQKQHLIKEEMTRIIESMGELQFDDKMPCAQRRNQSEALI